MSLKDGVPFLTL